jgi:hypothetical protein
VETIKRVIVSICGVAPASGRAVLEPGHLLRVGRTNRADFMVPHDEHMSGAHFALTWDGATCRLKDLGSATGTLVGGARVEEAALAHGDWIRAGQTDFLVHYEDNTPPPQDAPDQADEARRDRAASALVGYAEKERLYALLDAARDDRILTLLRESVEEHRSLFEGVYGEVMADAAPYLVSLPARSRLLPKLAREGFGKSWGVYLTSKRRFTELRSHLRKLLMVSEEGATELMYFRYYDPRVLRVFLPMSTARQVTEIYAEIDRFVVEGKDGANWIVFTGKNGAIQEETVAL